MNLIRVEVSCDRVYVNTEKNEAYVIRDGYDAGWSFLIKKFNPVGKDLRMIDAGAIREPLIKQNSAEYESVMKALEIIENEKKALVGFGEMFSCEFPQDFQEKVLWW